MDGFSFFAALFYCSHACSMYLVHAHFGSIIVLGEMRLPHDRSTESADLLTRLKAKEAAALLTLSSMRDFGIIASSTTEFIVVFDLNKSGPTLSTDSQEPQRRPGRHNPNSEPTKWNSDKKLGLCGDYDLTEIFSLLSTQIQPRFALAPDRCLYGPVSVCAPGIIREEEKKGSLPVLNYKCGVWIRVDSPLLKKND